VQQHVIKVEQSASPTVTERSVEAFGITDVSAGY